MSTTDSNAIENSEMIRVFKELVTNLSFLPMIKNEAENGLLNADLLYESIYDFGRYTHLTQNYQQLLTNEDKTKFKECFPQGFVKLVGYTPGLVNTISPLSINIARQRQSQIFFAKNELIDLYKELNEHKLPIEVSDALKNLEQSNNFVRNSISDWINVSYCEIDDEPGDVPNLNGVPETHDWWTNEHRQIWKNRQK